MQQDRTLGAKCVWQRVGEMDSLAVQGGTTSTRRGPLGVCAIQSGGGGADTQQQAAASVAVEAEHVQPGSVGYHTRQVHELNGGLWQLACEYTVMSKGKGERWSAWPFGMSYFSQTRAHTSLFTLLLVDLSLQLSLHLT